MERRFVLFLTVSMFILLANAWWTISHMEPPKPKAKVAANDGKQGVGELAAAKDDDKQEGEDGADEKSDDDAGAQAEKDAAAGDDAAEDDAQEKTPRQFVSLGSLDPKSPYQMLVTLTNAGAGVRRIELAGDRYLDLEDLQHRIGYVGNLELAEVDGGLEVQTAGAGTPAVAAGLQVGDRIVAAGLKEPAAVATVAQFAAATRGRPNGKVVLRIVRQEQEGAQEISVKLGRRPLELLRPESENARLWQDKLLPGFVEPASFRTTVVQIGDDSLGKIHADMLARAEALGEQVGELPAELPGIQLFDENWTIADRSEDSVTFERRLAKERLTFIKRYRLAKVAAKEDNGKQAEVPDESAAYHLVLEVAIRNDGEAERTIAYKLDGPNGLPIEGWWYANKVGRNWGAAGLRDVIGRHFGSSAPTMVAPATIAAGKAADFEAGTLAYMGVDAQYFSVVMIPQIADQTESWIERVHPEIIGPKPKERSSESRYANVSFGMFSVPATVKAGETLEHEYQIFAGPKRPDVLAQYVPAGSKAHSLGDLVYYGWYTAVARTMVGILHFFYSIVGNYGVSIIMLTVLVRGLMFPVSRNQAKSMAKMQLLKPEMDKLKEKYKGDQQKQAAAMQELYRKHGVNPLAGCLPMLIQLPVFVGLYRGLAVDIELRQAPLFGSLTRWCSNLAAPDMLLDWSGVMPDMINSGEGFFGFGPYLNVLPLVTMGLFLLQQKMFMPPPADEQAALQQKMMKYMMAFMGLMFYKVPSGLCLYFIASSLWGIAERKLIPQPTAPGLAATAPGPIVPRADRDGGDRKRISQKKRR